MFVKIFIYLVSLIPLLFITGPFLSGIGTVLISIFGLYSLSFFSNIKFHKSLKIFFIISILFCCEGGLIKSSFFLPNIKINKQKKGNILLPFLYNDIYCYI